jgi:predicted TIM-barrel fold metal-dependent hydrolase
MICDAHVHFFSPQFFDTLTAQKGLARSDALALLSWDDPASAAELADRWVAELDTHGVSRSALIASVPGDEDSVAEAVARHPTRFAGFFMVDPTRDDAVDRVRRALDRGLRGICLFPAMHRYPLQDERVAAIFNLANSHEAPSPPSRSDGPTVGESHGPTAGGRPVVFVHCGVLSVGVRKRLGLPSPFDIRYGNPLDLHALALKFAGTPIIVPHFGAGLFREALMLADLCPNVHLDTSSSNAWMRYVPGLTLAHVFRTALDVVGPDRLLFGTDSSFFPRGWHRAIYDEQQKAVADARVTPDARAKIFGGNFNRLFP